MYTRSTTAAEAVANRKWWLVDLEGQTLGRAAARIAYMLRGKHKPTYTPHIDDGDGIIVINAEKVHLTGSKWDGKKYYRHTTYPGGIKGTSAAKLRDRHPEDLLRLAVKGMVPAGPLGRAALKHLKIYSGAVHPHTAQVPEKLDLSTVLAAAR